MPLALGLLAEASGAAALAQALGYSCTVHIWDRMETAALSLCPPVTLVLKVQMQLHIKTAQPLLTAPPQHSPLQEP